MGHESEHVFVYIYIYIYTHIYNIFLDPACLAYGCLAFTRIANDFCSCLSVLTLDLAFSALIWVALSLLLLCCVCGVVDTVSFACFRGVSSAGLIPL